MVIVNLKSFKFSREQSSLVPYTDANGNYSFSLFFCKVHIPFSLNFLFPFSFDRKAYCKLTKSIQLSGTYGELRKNHNILAGSAAADLVGNCQKETDNSTSLKMPTMSSDLKNISQSLTCKRRLLAKLQL